MKCRPTYAVKDDGNQFFFGKNIIYQDGLILCHMELIGVQNNNFKVDCTPDNETIFKDEHILSPISIEKNQSTCSVETSTILK